MNRLEQLPKVLEGKIYKMAHEMSFADVVKEIRRDPDDSAMDFAMDKFGDLICDIKEMVWEAETYTEVVERSKTMAENAMDPGMNDDVRVAPGRPSCGDRAERWQSFAEDKLLDRILGRATDTIAYSEGLALEGAGSKDFFRVWKLVEAEAY